MRICTIIARRDLARARVLGRSSAACLAAGACSVLVLDDPEGTLGRDEPFEVLGPGDLGIDLEPLAAIYDAADLAALLKPRLLRHVLDRDRVPVLYVDPEVKVFAPLDPLERLLDADTIVLAGGTEYGLGFVALAPGRAADGLLAWWSDRTPVALADHRSLDRLDRDRFAEVASIVPAVRFPDDPGLAAAVWNLEKDALARAGSAYTIRGAPLRTFNFRGLDLVRPFSLAAGGHRIRLAESPALAALCDDYIAELRAAGIDRDRDRRWRYARLADGTTLNRVLRGLYADGIAAGAFRFPPFTEAGTEEFIAFCHEPAEVGGRHGLTRLCLAIYRDRPDLQASLTDLDGQEGASLLDWTARHGLAENGLTPRWLPDPGPPPPAPAGGGHDLGINVGGYLRSELGIGEVARSLIQALDRRGIPLLPLHGRLVPASRQGHSFAYLDTSAAGFPVNLICVNADHLAAFLADAGTEFSDGRYNVGFWWWEVPTLPEQSRAALDLVDEIWVGSKYVANALRPISPVPVTTIPTPVSAPAAKPRTRRELDLPEGFLFLFMFDFRSVFDRKNPLGVIEAFRTAFAPGSGASLVIKCINHADDADGFERLCRAAAEHPDIRIIARYETVDRKNAMLASCDCYVSLHRAEGFGLSLAEAMALGKPVIATAYSGNLDFMSEANSYLARYQLRAVGEGNHPYPAAAQWADPDLAHAAELMRSVFDRPEDARGRGRQAATDIARTHSPDAAGRAMSDRLDAIAARVGSGLALRHRSSGSAPGAIVRLLAAGRWNEQPPATSVRARNRLAHRLIGRALKPLERRQLDAEERTRRVLSALGTALDAADRERQRAADRRARDMATLLAELRRQGAELEVLRQRLDPGDEPGPDLPAL